MAELLVSVVGNNQSFDICPQVNDRELDVTSGNPGSSEEMVTLVLCSLFTWRRANEGDELPDKDSPLHGVWYDSFATVPGRKWGSRLWLLFRKIITEDVVNLARVYCEEALQGLVDDGYFLSLEVTTWRALEDSIYQINARVNGVLKNGARFSYEVPISKYVDREGS